MLVKICGINDFNIAKSLNALIPDMVGLVFVKKSSRYASIKEAKEIKKILDRSIKLVAIFQNHPIEEVNSIARELNVDFVQLHGEENPDYCAQISFSVIKAFSLEKSTKQTVEKLNQYKNVCAYFLVDRKTQGNGPLVDLDQVRVLSTNYKIILSGGLTQENISSVLGSVGTNIIGVDVSGGVEDIPGKKSITKVSKFIKKVRRNNA
jgi:phosphoribosylanthranilate isomerase